MKSVLKKMLAVILVTLLAFSCVASGVTAADTACDCEQYPSIVVPGLFQSKVLYLDENGNEMLNSEGEPYSAPFFLESSDEIVKLALKEALLPLGSLLLTQEDKEAQCAQAIADVAGQVLLSNLELDQYGQPIKNIQPDRYMTSFANLTQEQRDYAFSKVPLDMYAEIAGLDHLYFLSYIHTGNIKDIAEDLYELIQIAKEETGHDKVNLVPLSQGGSVENALMQYYVDNGLEFADDINRVCYVVPAADGAYVLGDIYRYGFIDEPEALYGYMLPSLFGEDNALSYAINLILRIFPQADLDNILDTAVNTLIEDYLEYSTCLWALIPSRDYPTLRDRFLSDPEDICIREQTDWYYYAQTHAREYILDAQAKGVEFFDIVNYNAANFKIFDSWDNENGDGVIHTDSESFGATTVAVDVPLPENYTQANVYCTDPENHNHMDEERLIDASTGIMCERTFYFKNQGHESTADNDVIIRLVIRILTDSSFEDVYSDPAFPQFNYARISRKVVTFYNEWTNYDTSALSPELAAKFEAANEKLGAAIESTYMPTEEFNAAAEEFEAVVYEIENGKEKKDGISDFLNNLLAKILKFANEILIKIFGGKGFSEMI